MYKYNIRIAYNQFYRVEIGFSKSGNFEIFKEKLKHILIDE